MRSGAITDGQLHPEGEKRIINRRCRCGKPAAETHRDCQWHAAVSAEYAADLLAFVQLLNADNLATLWSTDRAAAMRQLVETIECLELIDYDMTEHGDPLGRAVELLTHYAQEAQQHADQVTAIHKILGDHGHPCPRGDIATTLSKILNQRRNAPA